MTETTVPKHQEGDYLRTMTVVQGLSSNKLTRDPDAPKIVPKVDLKPAEAFEEPILGQICYVCHNCGEVYDQPPTYCRTCQYNLFDRVRR